MKNITAKPLSEPQAIYRLTALDRFLSGGGGVPVALFFPGVHLDIAAFELSLQLLMDDLPFLAGRQGWSQIFLPHFLALPTFQTSVQGNSISKLEIIIDEHHSKQ